MATKKRKTAPWDRAAPKRARHTRLTDAQKAEAKKRAKKAGRHYPNLVDNMAEARRSKAATRRH